MHLRTSCMIQFEEMGRKHTHVDKLADSCERCTLTLGVGVHGIGECPLEPLHSPLRFSVQVKKTRRDPEAIIQEYGAAILSQSPEGVRVLQNAKAKYPELIQRGEPGFEQYWGKEVRQREKEMGEVRAESQRLKREAGMV